MRWGTEHRTSKVRMPRWRGGSAFDVRCFLRLLVISLLFVTSAQAAITFDATPSGGASAATTLELVQDTAAGSPTGQYIGLRFSSSTVLTNVYARATVGGAGFSLDATEPATHFIGDLSSTAKTSYWFINNPTSGNGTFQVQIYVGDPAAGGVLQATSTSYTLRSLDSDQAAAANKILSVTINGGSPVVLGQNFDVVVVYTVNSTANILVQPAGTAAFDPATLRLGNTTVKLYSSSDGTTGLLSTLSNQLYFLAASSSTNSVRATYTFQAVAASSTSVSPLVSARSGQYKYNSDFSVPPVNVSVPAAVNRVSLAKSVNPATLSAGGTVTYTITATNSSASSTTLDSIVDTLPSGATYAANVKINGIASTLAPVISGSTLTFSDPGGTLVVPAGGTLQLKFDATLPNTASTYTNSVTGRIGSGVIGSTETLGSAPATAATVIAFADVSVTKTGPASIGAGVTFSYTISYVNNGPSAAANVVVRDTLPAAATFVSASGGGTLSAGVVTWPAIATLANGASGSYTVTVTAPANGSILNSAASTAATGDPTPANNDGSAAGARVTTTITTQADMVATVTGPATVLPGATFNYTVTATNYGLSAATNVILRDTLPSEVTFVSATGGGTLSAGVVTWPTIASLANGAAVSYTITVTAPATGTFTNVVSSTSATTDATPANNDGSAAASRVTTTANDGATVSGRVFADHGTGGGTANDGVLNGGETGIAGVTVKITDTTGATIHATTTTDGAGNYTLSIPSSVPAGTALKIVETNLAAWLSSGGSPGNTGGAYDRASDTVAFTVAAGGVYTAVNFADVAAFTFAPDNAQAGLPGSTVIYSHTFTAGTAGDVTFSISRISSPVLSGWTSTLHRDVNGNGLLDTGDTPIAGAITLTAGQTVRILVKENIPAGAPFNAQDQVTVTANFACTNASPALTAAATRTDLTTVGDPASAGLVLFKSVDKSTALPGETILYTITFVNNSSDPLGSVVIHDSNPAFTTFVSAANGPLPSGLTGVALSAPGVGASGAVRWTFTGALLPGAAGTVTFRVNLAQ